jgi:AraC-like DNA-binding protein
MTYDPPAASSGLLTVERSRVSRPVTMRSFHSHAAREIYWLMSGERYYFIIDRVFRVAKGDIVLIDSNTIHRTVNAGTSAGYERVLVMFSDDLIRGVPFVGERDLADVFRPGFRIVRPEPIIRTRLEQLLLHLHEEQTRRRSGHEIISVSILIELLALLRRAVPEGARVHEEHPSPLHARVSHIARYLGENHDADVSLDRLAVRFGTSKYHLCRTFKEASGSTILEYLNAVRVGEAKRLLLETSDPVSAVASAAGFSGTAHLDRVFGRVLGCTPLEYRRRHIDTTATDPTATTDMRTDGRAP